MFQSKLSPTFFRVFALSALLSVNVQAASDCKGLTEDICAENATSCDWISSYKRSDGKVIKGYCRTDSKTKKKAQVSKS